MDQLRELRFQTLEQVVGEVQQLHDVGYKQTGKWTLGQICQHLRRVQDISVDGFPFWISLFAFVRPVIRRVLLPKILSGNSPIGIPTSPMFKPAGDVQDAQEVELFMKSVRRFQNHQGAFHPHPGFGRMSKEELEAVHAGHAAHHLRFLVPQQ